MQNSDRLLEQLTTEEFHILELVSEGKKNKEIAQLCNLSPDTIKSNISKILLKLKVRNRTHATYMLGINKRFKKFETIIELTQKENEIIKFVILGYNNREIAKELNISTYTVKAHVNSILKKNFVHRRTNLAYIVGRSVLFDGMRNIC